MSEIKLNLPKAADLFSTQEERDDAKREKVVDIQLSELDNFPDHPFQVKNDDAMAAMVESVKAFGVQTPAIVRLKEDTEVAEGGNRYELVSGHRRKLACELAGLDSMPCIVREMSRDEAIIAMVDANLQREVILPSEKAKSYKMRLDAMNRQGQRTDLTYSPAGNKLQGKTSSAELSEVVGESKNQIFRYVRLNELIPEVLQLVDEGKIAMRPAVELSYLPTDQQSLLVETIESEESTPSHAQAAKMRKFSAEGRLNDDVMLSIMQEEKPNQVEQFKMPKDRISKFFKSGTPVERIQDTIVKALDYYQKHLERLKEREDERGER